ncbi:MAG TPA: hypothetical protein PL012_05010 [Candidatus Obscuribacter sp.]|nr:hypothetical protein [Candidatus Obscuribacter sp.]
MNQNKQNGNPYPLLPLILISLSLLTIVGVGLFSQAPGQASIPPACQVSVTITPQLDNVFVIEASGMLEAPDVVDIGGEAPGLTLVSGNDAFGLSFTEKPDLASTASQMVGKCVKVSGVLKEVGGVERPPRKVIDVTSLTNN